MRWIVVSLLLFNAGFLAWNSLSYRHRNHAEVAGLRQPSADGLLGAKLVLLSEARAETKAAQPLATTAITQELASVAPAVTSVTVDVEPASCVLLGAFVDVVSANALMGRLAVLGLQSKLGTISSGDAPNYWVILYPIEAAKFNQVLYEQLSMGNEKFVWRKDNCNKVASDVVIH